MRGRAGLVLFLFVVFVLIVLAQSGSLNGIFSAFNAGTVPNIYSVTAGPSLFATTRPLFSTAAPGYVLPTAYQPTAYMPSAYAPTYPSQSSGDTTGSTTGNTVGQAAPPSAGVVLANGQCVVPNGWTAYTIQSGDTLAIIAANYNLSAEQLAAANCIQNADIIYEGQVIAVP